MALFPFSCLPCVKHKRNIVALPLPVLDKGSNERLPLLPQVRVIDADQIVPVNDYG
jgi:hypothetical protein